MSFRPTRQSIEAKRSRFYELHADDPDLTSEQFAERLGVDKSTVKVWRRSLPAHLARD